MRFFLYNSKCIDIKPYKYIESEYKCAHCGHFGTKYMSVCITVLEIRHICIRLILHFSTSLALPEVVLVVCCIIPVLYHTVRYHTILYHTVLYCIILYCTVSYCTVSYCTVSYCTVSYCTVLYHTLLYCTIS